MGTVDATVSAPPHFKMLQAAEADPAMGDASGGAHLFGAISEEERNRLRDELSSYLLEFRNKVGSDGEQLVHYPENFNLVADSMNRSDLTSAEEKPWSKYLLSSDNMEDALDVDGRYRNVLSEPTTDVKYVKGIAQIQMYDKQLLSISRKAAQLKASQMQSEAAAENNDDAMSTGRRSERSSKSLFFLTKGKSEASATPRSESNVSSPEHTSRLTHEANADASPDNAAAEESSAARSIVSSDSKTALKRRNLIQENIRSVGNPHASLLSSDEEHRLQTLLDVDESGKEWQKLSKYGFSSAQLTHIAELDEQLQRFRPADSAADDFAPEGRGSEWGHDDAVEGLLNGEGGMDVHRVQRKSELATVPSSSLRRDYVAEQRLARQQSDYYNKLDSMLRSFTLEKADLSGLVEYEEEVASKHSASRTDVASLGGIRHQSSSVFSLPHPSMVDTKHKVTMKQVEEIIRATKGWFNESPSASSAHTPDKERESGRARPASYGAPPREEDGSGMSAYGSDAEAATSPASFESQQLASRHDIDRLMGSLRFEVQRLAALREKARATQSRDSHTQYSSGMQSTPQSASSGLLRSGSNWQHISPAVSVLEDQMAHMQDLESDILMRFGIPSPPSDKGDDHQQQPSSWQPQSWQPQPQRQQLQQNFFTLSSFRLGQGPGQGEDEEGQKGRERAPFLPIIKGSISGAAPSNAIVGAGVGSYSSLPLIAESFRKKIKSLRVTRGIIGAREDGSEDLPFDDGRPPPPPVANKPKVLI